MSADRLRVFGYGITGMSFKPKTGRGMEWKPSLINGQHGLVMWVDTLMHY